ncbi:HAD domain-containing protein [Noviherbaspirillum sedimenti]|uniref:HAD domain-containing protein n=1 Tax=Noviherbaspirillum sedimenti TaxID=2320865 RepID=UPI001314D131
MILFLDFDGALHPEFCNQGEELLCHREKLEMILHDYSQVEIVISSIWRQT